MMSREEWELVIKAVSNAIIEKHGDFHPNKLHPGIGEIALLNEKKIGQVYYIYEELWEQYYKEVV